MNRPIRPSVLLQNGVLLRRALVAQKLWTAHVETRTAKLPQVCESRRIQAENILTPEELADKLKVKPSWIYEKCRTRCPNPLPCMRVGRYVRFDWDDIITWLEQQKNGRSR